MRRIARIAVLALAFGLATWTAGWWSVCVVAAAWPWIARGSRHPVLEATAGASLAWTGILAWTAATGPLGELLRRVAGIFGAPGWAIVTAAIVFGALLAWSSATISAAAARLRPLR